MRAQWGSIVTEKRENRCQKERLFAHNVLMTVLGLLTQDPLSITQDTSTPREKARCEYWNKAYSSRKWHYIITEWHFLKAQCHFCPQKVPLYRRKRGCANFSKCRDRGQSDSDTPLMSNPPMPRQHRIRAFLANTVNIKEFSASHPRFFHSEPISSSDLPLVSGTSFHTKRAAMTHISP